MPEVKPSILFSKLPEEITMVPTGYTCYYIYSRNIYCKSPLLVDYVRETQMRMKMERPYSNVTDVSGDIGFETEAKIIELGVSEQLWDLVHDHFGGNLSATEMQGDEKFIPLLRLSIRFGFADLQTELTSMLSSHLTHANSVGVYRELSGHSTTKAFSICDRYIRLFFDEVLKTSDEPFTHEELLRFLEMEQLNVNDGHLTLKHRYDVHVEPGHHLPVATGVMVTEEGCVYVEDRCEPLTDLKSLLRNRRILSVQVDINRLILLDGEWMTVLDLRNLEVERDFFPGRKNIISSVKKFGYRFVVEESGVWRSEGGQWLYWEAPEEIIDTKDDGATLVVVTDKAYYRPSFFYQPRCFTESPSPAVHNVYVLDKETQHSLLSRLVYSRLS